MLAMNLYSHKFIIKFRRKEQHVINNLLFQFQVVQGSFRLTKVENFTLKVFASQRLNVFLESFVRAPVALPVALDFGALPLPLYYPKEPLLAKVNLAVLEIFYSVGKSN